MIKVKLTRSTVVAIVAVGLMASAPAAVAQETAVDGYQGVAGETQTGVEGDAAVGAASGSGSVDDGALPFTGLDLGLALGGGLLLLGIGLALSRVVARPDTA